MQGDPETVGFPSGELDLYGRLRHCADDAPTLVLLSGLGFHTFEYEPLAAHLAAAGCNSLNFDFRGHGRSGGRRGAWILDELACTSRCSSSRDATTTCNHRSNPGFSSRQPATPRGTRS